MTRGFRIAALISSWLVLLSILPAGAQDRPKGPEAKVYTAEQFLKALTEGQLKEAAGPLAVYGAVKAGDKTLQVSTAGACGSWTAIPQDLIEKVEHLSTTRCGEQEHPFARIHLKEPPSGNAEAVAFSNLLRQSRTPISAPSASALTLSPGTLPNILGSRAVSRLPGVGGTLGQQQCILIPKLECWQQEVASTIAGLVKVGPVFCWIIYIPVCWGD